MSLIYGSLASLVVTVIVTESYLFGPLRAFAHQINRHLGVLFICYLCFGTWVGIVLGFLIDGPYHPVINGLAYHGLAYLLHAALELVGDVRIKLQR